MSQADPTTGVSLSILDRLLDDDPDSQREAPKSASQLSRQVEQSIRRDLENLLNTRIRCDQLPADLPEVRHTIVDYGIPDATSADLRSRRRRNEFLNALAASVQAHDARFAEVQITALDNADDSDSTLRFQIRATLRLAGEMTPITFDSMLEPAGQFKIQGETA